MSPMCGVAFHECMSVQFWIVTPALSCCAVLHRRHELEMAGIGLALQAMWAANVLDIQKTLHQVGRGSAKP